MRVAVAAAVHSEIRLMKDQLARVVPVKARAWVEISRGKSPALESRSLGVFNLRQIP